MAPIEQLNSQPDSISALKLVRSIKKRKLLSFKEMLDLPMKNSFNIKDYKKLDLEIIDNSSNMIRLVIIEFIERMNGTFIETENDRYLQKKFIKLFKPGHYGYESGGKISSVFLRKYSNLL
jgi:putative glycosyltransferase (TIGR04372 family)